MIYLTEKDWTRVEDSLIGKNSTKIHYYTKIYNLMKYINSNLKFSSQVGQIILSTAMIYLHKYNTVNEHKIFSFSFEEFIFFSSASIFLACKSTNRLISITHIVPIIKAIIIKKQLKIKTDEESIKEKIFDYEFDILSSLQFDLNFDLPYRYLKKLTKFFQENIKIDASKLTKLCCYFINDTFILPLCLFFHPAVIAASCVSLLSKKHKLIIDMKKLVTFFNENIEEEEIKNCERIVKKIYDKSDGVGNKDHCDTQIDSAVKMAVC